MKKLMALCVLLALMGMLSVSGTLATSETQENTNPLAAFFEKVTGLLSGFSEAPETGNSLKIKTLFQMRDALGTVKDGSDNYLQAVNTAALNPTENISINGFDCFFWPQSSGATDKIVSVKNTATESVYFRTALLFKCNEIIWQNMALNRNTADYDWTEKRIAIGGDNYPMLIATYRDRLSGGKISSPMLLQIAVDSSAVGALDTFGFETQTFAIQADAFGSSTIDAALNAAIPPENIAASFGGTLSPWAINLPERSEAK